MKEITSITSYDIKLSGIIHSSNFDEIKQAILARIESSKIELKTDENFHQAKLDVKQFKLVEETLRKVKQSAINQAEEIEKLFSEIDEVTQSTRQARLSLERQVKTRTLEIKNECIQSGIDEIQSFIDEQVDEFKHIDKSLFLDRTRFEYAAKGKANIESVKYAIDLLCVVIKKEISEKNTEVQNNKTKIDALNEDHKLLFQDWKSLQSLSETDLTSEIDKRIKLQNENIARKEEAKNKATILEENTTKEDLTAPKGTTTNQVLITPKEKYQIIVEILSTRAKAVELEQSIKDAYGSDPSINDIKLTRNLDEHQ